MNTFDLSVIIVNYNTKDFTLACIESIKKFTKNLKYEIILVENSNEDPILRHKNVKIIRSKTNLGFTGGNNQGMKAAEGRYVLLLNSDTLIYDNVLSEMVHWLDKNKDIGIASCTLKNKDGSVQPTGGYFPTLLRVFSWMTIQDLPFIDNFILPFHPKQSVYKSIRELDWVTGAFMLIRREVINQIGYLDEDYFMYTEDTDFCYRALRQPTWKGRWKVVYNPRWSITHFGGASSIREFPILSEYRNIELFYKKHYPEWQYPVLKLFLKIGALGRMLVLGTIKGKEYAKIYANAYKGAR